jgi:F0F1-type ATP synthase assembly protein I
VASPVVAGLRYAALGIEFAAIIVVAVVAGYHVDIWLGTAPWLMLVFIAGGFFGALKRLLWSLKRDSSPG